MSSRNVEKSKSLIIKNILHYRHIKNLASFLNLCWEHTDFYFYDQINNKNYIIRIKLNLVISFNASISDKPYRAVSKNILNEKNNQNNLENNKNDYFSYDF